MLLPALLLTFAATLASAVSGWTTCTCSNLAIQKFVLNSSAKIYYARPCIVPDGCSYDDDQDGNGESADMDICLQGEGIYDSWVDSESDGIANRFVEAFNKDLMETVFLGLPENDPLRKPLIKNIELFQQGDTWNKSQELRFKVELLPLVSATMPTEKLSFCIQTVLNDLQTVHSLWKHTKKVIGVTEVTVVRADVRKAGRHDPVVFLFLLAIAFVAAVTLVVLVFRQFCRTGDVSLWSRQTRADLVAARLYHGDGFYWDLFYNIICTKHQVFSVFLAHKKHPYSKCERCGVLYTVLMFVLVLSFLGGLDTCNAVSVCSCARGKSYSNNDILAPCNSYSNNGKMGPYAMAKNGQECREKGPQAAPISVFGIVIILVVPILDFIMYTLATPPEKGCRAKVFPVILFVFTLGGVVCMIFSIIIYVAVSDPSCRGSMFNVLAIARLTTWTLALATFDPFYYYYYFQQRKQHRANASKIAAVIGTDEHKAVHLAASACRIMEVDVDDDDSVNVFKAKLAVFRSSQRPGATAGIDEDLMGQFLCSCETKKL